MMRYLSVLFVLAVFLSACSGEKKPADDRAAKAAKEYYDLLRVGKYAEYVAGMSDADSLPPSYRDQLITNAKQFLAQQRDEHGGIAEVRVVGSKCDSLQHRTDVFLTLAYGDSAKEEIVVPMVECDGVWKMK